MGELPPHAKALLALAKDADDPPPGAQAEVRRATALAIAAGSAGGGLGGSKVAAEAASMAQQGLRLGVGGAFGAKTLLLAAAVITGGTWFGLQEFGRTEPKAAPNAAAAETPKRAAGSAAPEPDTLPVLDNRAHASKAGTAGARRAARTRSPAPSSEDRLGEEVALLRAASRAIAEQRPADGLRLLQEHKERFTTALLWEERVGLTALARCMLDPVEASARAHTFLKRHANSVLAARIARACNLGEAP